MYTWEVASKYFDEREMELVRYKPNDILFSIAGSHNQFGRKDETYTKDEQS